MRASALSHSLVIILKITIINKCENNMADGIPATFDPINNPIDALRLEFGDLDEYNYILTDQSYQYFILKYPESPRMVLKSVGSAILAKFAKEGYRQRVGQEEAYLGDRYKNYLDFLKQKASNPLLSGIVPAVFVGGVLRDSTKFLEENPEYIDSMFYRGQHTRTPYWNNKRIAGVKNTKEVDEQGIYNRMIVP